MPDDVFISPIIKSVPVTLKITPLEDVWDGYSDERSTIDHNAGETVYYREHLKTRKRTEIRRETYYE